MRRITIVEYITLESNDNPPLQITNLSNANLKSVEQPYQRVLNLTQAPLTLSPGWIEKHSLLHICHHQPKFERQPTKEEREATKLQIVEISFGGVVFSLSPGESFRGVPKTLSGITLRVTQGTAKITITILPE